MFARPHLRKAAGLLGLAAVALALYPSGVRAQAALPASPAQHLALQDTAAPAPGPAESEHLEVPQDGSVRVIVRAFETAAIASEINARITYLPAREGDAFRRGDLLIEFDCRRGIAEHDAADATMKELQAAYQSQLKMLEYKSAGTVAVEQARYQFEKAKAELRVSAVRLDSCRVFAPFDGLVTEKAAQVHEIAQPNQPLIKIINQTKIELLMMVPSAWLPQIAGATFPVRIDETGEVYEARVLQSTGLIDPVSQTSRVIAELVEPSPRIMPGMSGSAEFFKSRASR